MTNTIFILVVGDRHTPARATLKLNMLDIDASVDDISVNTLTTLIVIDVLVEGIKGQLGPMTCTSQALQKGHVRLKL